MLVPSATLLAQVDAAFRGNATFTPAPPTRFYLNLTERCGLRCPHCINGSPRRTAEARARDMSPAVLAALAPHLAHATYVGLTHAGEPLLAPVLEPLLHGLHRARSHAPTAVHVVTNGEQLDAARFARLSDLGLNSWSISLDGLSAASHDALRSGSRVERNLALIAAVATTRRRACPDVRLSLAWTLTRANLHEVPALLELATGWGIDVVKLEELFATNAEVTQAWRPTPDAVTATLAQARHQAQALGVRLLDHVTPREAWCCRGADDSELGSFIDGDNRLNRMPINGCRLPWEVVCVEPDGTVKPLDFWQPAAGNLLQTDLATLWNGPAFVAARQRSIWQRRCPPGGVVCPPAPPLAQW